MRVRKRSFSLLAGTGSSAGERVCTVGSAIVCVRWPGARDGLLGVSFSAPGVDATAWEAMVERSGDVAEVCRVGLTSACFPAAFVRFEVERVGVGVGLLSCLYSSAAVSFRASTESSRITSSQLFVLCTGGPRSFRSPRSGLLRRGEIEEEMRDFRPCDGGVRAVVEERESTGRRQGTFQTITSSGRSSSNSSYSASSSLAVLRALLGFQERRFEGSMGETSEWRRGVSGERGDGGIGELWVLCVGKGRLALGGESDIDGLVGERFQLCRGEGGWRR